MFRLFVFLVGLLGFWQQLCILEVTVFSELQGQGDFIGHSRTTVSPAGAVSSHRVHCVLGKCAASLQVTLVWRQGPEFYRGHAEIWDDVDSPK